MARKEDLRIIKTKNALTNAFFDMLSDMPLEEVTVNELCERAGIRRATFYKHFKDKNDFINFLIVDVRDKFDNEHWNEKAGHTITLDYYLRYAEEVIKYLLSREAAIKRIIKSPIRSSFIEVFVHKNYVDTKRRLEESAANGMKLPFSPEFIASIIIGGTAYTIVTWFEAEERCSVNELISDISRFITKSLS